MNKSSRLSFLIGGILCCLTFVGYSSSSQRTSDSDHQREELYLALGIPFSPWYESTEKLEDGRTVSAEWQVNVLSWSWVALFAGVAALGAWWRSRPGATSGSQTTGAAGRPEDTF